MARKFGSSSLNYTPQATRIYILSATFSDGIPDELEVPCFEDYFDGLGGDFGVENQEALLESG
jgi:hypothetical protein